MTEDTDKLIQVKTEFVIADAETNSRAWAVVHRRQNGVLWITSLWVHPDERKKGWAGALLDRVLREYVGETLYLEVAPYADRPMDTDALTVFYARFGFLETHVPGVMVLKR